MTTKSRKSQRNVAASFLFPSSRIVRAILDQSVISSPSKHIVIIFKAKNVELKKKVLTNITNSTQKCHLVK